MAEQITIYCKNTGNYYEVPVGSSLLDIYKIVGEPLPYRPLNAQVNNRTQDLTYTCWQPKDIEFVDYTNPSGMRTYVRTLCYVLSKAVHDVFPEATLNIEHSISKGYFCTIHNGKPADIDMLAQIRQRMKEIVDADIPLKLHTAQSEKAIQLFREVGMEDKANLIESSGMMYASYYELEGYVNYFYGGLAPSTGYVPVFELEPYLDGALLRVPERTNPHVLAPKVLQNKMFEAYKEHLNLQRALGLNNVGDLNMALEHGHASEVIMISEAMQEKKIARIADEIAERYKKGVRIVLIAGPSSSGKTTTCKRLEIQLATNLLRPVGISLDDYFVNREDTPKDESGDYDFESLYALDLPYFNSDLQRLINGEEIELPSFDFNSGKRVYKGKKMKLYDNSVIVIEGIHGLNPKLTEYLPHESLFKIFISALTVISIDNHNIINPSDNRLIRRMVRDHKYRGYSALDTLKRWESVLSGEQKHITPYQEEADVMFNSALVYELGALKQQAVPLLEEVLVKYPEHSKAKRLLKFFSYVQAVPTREIPPTSILREFLGGSSFKY